MFYENTSIHRIIHNFSKHRINSMYRIVNIEWFRCIDVYRISLLPSPFLATCSARLRLTILGVKQQEATYATTIREVCSGIPAGTIYVLHETFELFTAYLHKQSLITRNAVPMLFISNKISVSNDDRKYKKLVGNWKS